MSKNCKKMDFSKTKHWAQKDWICSDCGKIYGRIIKGHVCTWHYDTCDFCGKNNVVCTEPRDFGIKL